MRVRRRGGQAYLTVKAGAGRVRVEEEIEIEGDRFERLWPLTEGRRIEKTRYVIDAGDGDLVIELDVYTGDLDGLVTAEVEFDSEVRPRPSSPPAGWARTSPRISATRTSASRARARHRSARV